MVRFSETAYLEVSGEVRRHMWWQKLPTPPTAGLRVSIVPGHPREHFYKKPYFNVATGIWGVE